MKRGMRDPRPFHQIPITASCAAVCIACLLTIAPRAMAAELCCDCKQTGDANKTCLLIDEAQLGSGSDCTALPEKAGLGEGWTCESAPLNVTTQENTSHDGSRCKTIASGGVCINRPMIAADAKNIRQGETVVSGAEKAEDEKPLPFHLNIDIPGFSTETVTPSLFADYLIVLIRYGISIVAIVSTIMFIYGAFQYLIGSALPSITNGKAIMKDAIVGLILVMSSTLILRTVNPNLEMPIPLNVTQIEMIPEPTGTVTERDASGTIVTTPILGRSKGNTCLLKTFGSNDAEVGKRITTVMFLGDKHFLHELAAPDFEAAFREIEAAPNDSAIGAWVQMMKRMPPYSAMCGKKSGYPDRGSRTGGSYAPRLDARLAKAEGEDRGPCVSCDLHALGLATDIDPCFNTMCPKGETCTLSDGKYNRMPMEIVEVFARHHIYWGGYGWKDEGADWNAAISRRDAMHFEWHGICWQ